MLLVRYRSAKSKVLANLTIHSCQNFYQLDLEIMQRKKSITSLLVFLASMQANAQSEKALTDTNVKCSSYAHRLVLLTQSIMNNMSPEDPNRIGYQAILSRAGKTLERNFKTVTAKIDNRKLTKEGVDEALGHLGEKNDAELSSIAHSTVSLFEYQTKKEKSLGCMK